MGANIGSMDVRLDIDLLRALVAVAEAGSFTRAGRRLGRTQSAVSLQIRRLEEQLEARLLLRNPRGVALTSAGEALIVYARRILELEEAAIQSVLRPDETPGVRIGLPDVYARRYLPRALARFGRTRPEVYCDVSDRLAERFEAGELDVCLTVRHRGGGQTLGVEELQWVCAPSLAFGPEEAVPLAVYPEPCVFRAHALRALAEAGRRWRVTYTSQSTSAIDLAIEHGWGVAIKTRRTVEPGWRVVERDLPSLAPVELVLRRASDATRDAVQLADILAETVSADLRGAAIIA